MQCVRSGLAFGSADFRVPTFNVTFCGNCSHLFYVQKCNEHGTTGSNSYINCNLKLQAWLVVMELIQ